MKTPIKCHAPEHDHQYEAAAIKAMRQDVADNPDLSAAPAQARSECCNAELLRDETDTPYCPKCGLEYGDDSAPAQAQPRKADAASHSPLPWRVEAAIGNWSAGIDDANGLAVVYVSDQEDEGIRLPKDAAYIVRACNNAQRLADALQKSLENPTSNQARFEGFQALDAWKEEATTCGHHA